MNNEYYEVNISANEKPKKLDNLLKVKTELAAALIHMISDVTNVAEKVDIFDYVLPNVAAELAVKLKTGEQEPNENAIAIFNALVEVLGYEEFKNDYKGYVSFLDAGVIN